MSAGTKAVVAVIYLVLLSPIFPLGIGWHRILQRTSDGRSAAALFSLSLATLSFLWLLAILVWGRGIAPDYSHLRFNTIYANIGALFVGWMVAAFRAPQPKAPLVWASVLLLVLWLYVGAVSSAV